MLIVQVGQLKLLLLKLYLSSRGAGGAALRAGALFCPHCKLHVCTQIALHFFFFLSFQDVNTLKVFRILELDVVRLLLCVHLQLIPEVIQSDEVKISASLLQIMSRCLQISTHDSQEAQ